MMLIGSAIVHVDYYPTAQSRVPITHKSYLNSWLFCIVYLLCFSCLTRNKEKDSRKKNSWIISYFNYLTSNKIYLCHIDDIDCLYWFERILD